MSTEIMLADGAVSITQALAQRELVMQSMKEIMHEDQHYGKIPGCGEKPTLLQPGAQTLAFMFRLRPEYAVEWVDRSNGHRECRVLCKLIHAPTGMEAGQGVGLCTTSEGKYRFRNEAKSIEWTNEIVPSKYWDLRKKDPKEAAAYVKQLFDGADNISTKKKPEDGCWYFVKMAGGDGKVENPNLDDTLNTVLKIGKKRAFVDAVITATASSDLFTQDLEDIRDNIAATADYVPDVGKPAQQMPSDKPSAPSASPAPSKAKTPPVGQSGAKAAPSDKSTHPWRDKLEVRALAKKVPLPVILAVAQKTHASKAKWFAEIEEDIAQHMMEHGSETEELVKMEMDNLPL